MDDSTRLWGLKVGQCETEEEFNQLVAEHQRYYRAWGDVLRPMLLERGISVQDLAKGCGVGISTARDFLKKIPARRSYVIMIAIMMGLNRDQTNRLLTRFAQYQQLYPRSVEDVIWCYMIAGGKHMHPKDLYQAYYAEYEKVRQSCGYPDREVDGKPGSTRLALQKMEFYMNQPHGITVQSDDNYRQMMAELLPEFKGANRRLLDKLKEYLDSPSLQQERKKRANDRESSGDSRFTANQLYQGNHAGLLRYYKRLSELKNKGKVPERKFLLSFAIRLGLTTDSINQLLECAGMAPLCPKDRLECAIIFYLEEAYLNFPSLFSQDTQQMEGPGQNMWEYEDGRPVLQGQDGYLKQVLKILDDGDETPKTYLQRCLENSEVFSDGDRKAIFKFLDEI